MQGLMFTSSREGSPMDSVWDNHILQEELEARRREDALEILAEFNKGREEDD